MQQVGQRGPIDVEGVTDQARSLIRLATGDGARIFHGPQENGKIPTGGEELSEVLDLLPFARTCTGISAFALHFDRRAAVRVEHAAALRPEVHLHRLFCAVDDAAHVQKLLLRTLPDRLDRRQRVDSLFDIGADGVLLGLL